MTYYNQLNYTVNNGRKWVPVTKMLQINDDHRTMQCQHRPQPLPSSSRHRHWLYSRVPRCRCHDSQRPRHGAEGDGRINMVERRAGDVLVH